METEREGRADDFRREWGPSHADRGGQVGVRPGARDPARRDAKTRHARLVAEFPGKVPRQAAVSSRFAGRRRARAFSGKGGRRSHGPLRQQSGRPRLLRHARRLRLEARLRRLRGRRQGQAPQLRTWVSSRFVLPQLFFHLRQDHRLPPGSHGERPRRFPRRPRRQGDQAGPRQDPRLLGANALPREEAPAQKKGAPAPAQERRAPQEEGHPHRRGARQDQTGTARPRKPRTRYHGAASPGLRPRSRGRRRRRPRV
mmetsp:Transcript_25313/g.78019  ORF Transcript_25313/g.78019 Transcript_25313/m.78019 type:complete len:256 (-) Transcript_25313:318-1085(-)